MLTGKHCDDIQDIIDAAKAIHAKGVEIVAVSLGADGSLAVSDEGTYRAIVPKIDAVNTVGCGDSILEGHFQFSDLCNRRFCTWIKRGAFSGRNIKKSQRDLSSGSDA